MGVKTSQHQIGRHQYTITTFNTTTALQLKAALLKVVGPAVGELGEVTGVGAGGLQSAEPDALQGSLSRAVELLVDRIDENTVSLFKRLIANCAVDLERENGSVTVQCVDVFDDHFQADGMAELYRLIAKVVEVNYSGFLAELLNVAKARAVQLSATEPDPAPNLEAVG